MKDNLKRNKVNNINKNLILKPIKYEQRINKNILMVYYLDKLYKQGNLKEEILEISMTDVDTEIPSLIDKVVKDEVIQKEREKMSEIIIKEMRKKRKLDIRNFFIMLYNQTLVILCTIFDTFLIDSLEVITIKKRKVLIGLSKNEKDITVEEVIKSKDYKEVYNTIKSKVLRRFEFKGIEDKLY